MNFEWDENKAKRNYRQRGVRFEEAISIFSDPLAITIYDPAHSTTEERFVDIGYSNQGRVLVVVYTERKGNIRLISVREATKIEKRDYEQGNT
jgi:hypothetical protein